MYNVLVQKQFRTLNRIDKDAMKAAAIRIELLKPNHSTFD
jgi:hypothetical protein